MQSSRLPTAADKVGKGVAKYNLYYNYSLNDYFYAKLHQILGCVLVFKMYAYTLNLLQTTQRNPIIIDTFVTTLCYIGNK